MTAATETHTVSRETVALIPASLEGATSSAADPAARAEALSWAPNTRKAYVAGWNGLTSWCIENRCSGLPAAPAAVGRYLEDLVDIQGKALPLPATAWANIPIRHLLYRMITTFDRQK